MVTGAIRVHQDVEELKRNSKFESFEPIRVSFTVSLKRFQDDCRLNPELEIKIDKSYENADF